MGYLTVPKSQTVVNIQEGVEVSLEGLIHRQKRMWM